MKSRSGTRNGFTTAEGNQPSVQIQVYQGECEIAAYNKKLGMFELTGLPSAFRGLPQIEVTFDIDSRGSIDVAAKDLTTGAVEQMETMLTTPSGRTPPVSTPWRYRAALPGTVNQERRSSVR